MMAGQTRQILKESELKMAADEREGDLIRRKIFSFLSCQLGSEWSMFISTLPGWRAARAQVVIEHKRDEERTVVNQIYACLMTWQQECPTEVTVQNILQALGNDGVNRMDLKQEVERLADVGLSNLL